MPKSHTYKHKYADVQDKHIIHTQKYIRYTDITQTYIDKHRHIHYTLQQLLYVFKIKSKF